VAIHSHHKADSTISVVHSGDLSDETAQTTGSLRLSAFSATHGISSSLWAGIFVVEPSAKTGIHHHGEQDTVVYVLQGEAVICWGERGENFAIVRPGDFLHVPARLPHREENPSKDEQLWSISRMIFGMRTVNEALHR
jgi:uncharacterized RmlC-like cupin family protein